MESIRKVDSISVMTDETPKNSEAKSGLEKFLVRRSTIWSILLFGTVLRVAIVAGSIGTNDVYNWLQFDNLLGEVGISDAYGHHPELNHPPLMLVILHGLSRLSSLTGIQLTDLLRLLQTAADALAYFVLLFLGRELFPPRLATTPAFVLMLAPISMFISGFHANSDPLMISLVLLAVGFFVADRSFLSGIALGLACGIKILPLLVVPFFFLLSRRADRVRFILGLASSLAGIFLPLLVTGGTGPLRQIFGYSGLTGEWGLIPTLLLLNQRFPDALTSTALFKAAVIYNDYGRSITVAGLFILYAWCLRLVGSEERERMLISFIGLTFLLFLALTPSYGVQYLVWPVAFLSFLLSFRTAIALIAVLSAYVFLTYTIWSGGFPWWYADSIRYSPLKYVILLAGIPVWFCIIAATVNGVMRIRATIRR